MSVSGALGIGPARRARVQVMTDSGTRKLVFIGNGSAGGTYVLRIRVRKPIAIALGRFKNGKIIQFKPGEYAYIGSAMGKNGSAVCLSKRLVRHASRLGDNPPHLIRELMRSTFPKKLKAAGELLSLNPKKQKWQVDCPLDHADVELVGVFAISTPHRIEGRLAKHLETEPGTYVFESGAGASDIKGNTHFLRVDGGKPWWDRLPYEIQRVLLVAQLLDRHPEFSTLIGTGPTRISGRQLIKLLNMWHERAADIFNRMSAGDSFSRAEVGSQGIYDTCDWGEVTSRLCRARGGLELVVGAIKPSGNFPDRYCGDRSTIRELAARCKNIGTSLAATVSRMPAVGSASPYLRTSRPSPSTAATEVSVGKVAGFLKLSIRFLGKCLHDAPLITAKTGCVLTADVKTQILAEQDQIIEALNKILTACDVR